MTRDKIIQGLREVATLLETKPDFPAPWKIGPGDKQRIIGYWVWSLDELKDLERRLGSFKTLRQKGTIADYFELVVTLPSGLELVYYTERSKARKAAKDAYMEHKREA